MPHSEFPESTGFSCTDPYDSLNSRRENPVDSGNLSTSWYEKTLLTQEILVEKYTNSRRVIREKRHEFGIATERLAAKIPPNHFLSLVVPGSVVRVRSKEGIQNGTNRSFLVCSHMFIYVYWQYMFIGNNNSEYNTTRVNGISNRPDV